MRSQMKMNTLITFNGSHFVDRIDLLFAITTCLIQNEFVCFYSPFD